MAEILVLDDVLDAGVLIRRILGREGHQVSVFTEEEDAVGFVEKHPVDLAILDIKLKKMSGVEVLEELKKIDPNVSVMMLSGYPTLETARKSMDLGADEYCVKPIEKKELQEKVAAILAKRREKGF